MKLPNFPYFYFTIDYRCSFEKLSENNKAPIGTVEKKWFENALTAISDKKYVIDIDNRLPAISIHNNENILTEEMAVYNYTCTFFRTMIMDEMIQRYIKLGLIPLCFYPTSHIDFIESVDTILLNLGLYHYKLPAIYRNNNNTSRKTTFDSWVSRIDVSSILQCLPEKISMQEVYKKVIQL